MMEGDHSIKTVQSKGAAITHSSGGKIPYVSTHINEYETDRLAAILNMFGHLPVAGTHNLRTGKPIQQ